MNGHEYSESQGRGPGRGCQGNRGGGRGRRGGGFGLTSNPQTNDGGDNHASTAFGNHLELSQFLSQIHNQNYSAYKSLKGRYTWTQGLPIELLVDHVQGDPYAAPSRFCARLPLRVSGIPTDVYCNKTRVIAFCDYINRRIVSLVRQWRLDVADSTGNYHGPKGGDFNIYKPRQQILERSSCVITSLPDNDPFIEIRFTVTLPAHGRSINGRKAQELLVTHLPNIMERGLLWEHQDEERVWTHLRTMEVQESLRNNLAKLGLVAFVGNKSILPRASGADPRPMKESVVVFQSPSNLEVTIATGIQDHTGQPISVTGMGIPRGITVIAGGGFHGKSTLLEALQFGIYNVVPGDGRELVVTEPNVFKVRAEDGRNVVCTDISPFISKLPGGKSTTSFTTMDASGSTSMSANIQEALEIGATALIIDEDTSATNFLVRDSKMHELVRTEPITPLVSKVDALYRERDVSTIIVVGGCGDYLNPASTVLAKYPNAAPSSPIYGPIPNRVITLPGLGDKPPTARGIDKVLFKLDRTKVNTEDANAEVDITALEQFVEEGQTNLCVDALRVISGGSLKSVRSWVDELEKLMDQKGMNIRGDQKPFGNIARARPLEILAVVNRVRGLRVGDSFQAAQALLGNKQKRKYSLADHGAPYKKVQAIAEMWFILLTVVRDGLRASIWQTLMDRTTAAYIQLLRMYDDYCREKEFIEMFDHLLLVSVNLQAPT